MSYMGYRNMYNYITNAEQFELFSLFSLRKEISTQDFIHVLPNIQPSIIKNSVFARNVQQLNWEDIGGLEEIKMRVSMMIEWPLLHPEAFAKVGLPCPKGVLLFGPPGCCKTTLVRVLATECNATFFSASASQVYSSFVGDSEKLIIQLFSEARLCAPSIVFLDEIDSLVGSRTHGNKHRGVQEKVLSALLNEMDGCGIQSESLQGCFTEYSSQGAELKSNGNIVVVGATNRIDLIDDALLRPGRFDTILYVPPPDVKQRYAILKLQTKNCVVEDADIRWVAEQTERFSGADLKNLWQVVFLKAYKTNASIIRSSFESALKICHPSITQQQLAEYEMRAAKLKS